MDALLERWFLGVTIPPFVDAPLLLLIIYSLCWYNRSLNHVCVNLKVMPS